MAKGEFSREGAIALSLCALGMMFSSGPAVLATFSLFMLPMAQDFGWGRGAISSSLLLSSGGSAVVAAFAGKLLDKVGLRAVLIPALIVYGLAYGALAFVGGSIWTFYAIHLVVGASSALCGAVPYSKLVSHWFAVRRGLALGLTIGAGASVGSVAMAQTARWLIETWGWREARLTIAAAILLLPLPLIALFLRDRPKAQPNPTPVEVAVSRGLPTAAHRGQATGVMTSSHAGGVRRDPTFWVVMTMILVSTTMTAGVSVHMVAMVTDLGETSITAVSVYSLYMVAVLVGRIAAGWLLDRVLGPKIGALAFISAFLGFTLMKGAHNAVDLVVASLFLGLCSGATLTIASYWTSRYWGLQSFGSSYGLIYAAITLGGAVGPLALGFVFDRSGSYAPGLGFAQLGMIFCALGAWALKPYVHPVKTRSAA